MRNPSSRPRFVPAAEMAARLVTVFLALELNALAAQIRFDGDCALVAEEVALLQVMRDEDAHMAGQQVIDHLVQQSKDLSGNFERMSRATGFDLVTRHLMSSLRVCGGCDQFRRVGERRDGGYLMCIEGGLAGSGIQAAYSMGVERYDKWSVDMAALLRGAGRAGNVVHQFDCTVPVGQDCQGCAFYHACIGPDGSEGGGAWNFSRVLKETGLQDAPDRSLILKMDIEGAEIPTLASLSLATLKKFQQVVVEFHQLTHVKKHERMDQAVSKLLDAGFRVVHLHGNNCCGMFTAPGTNYSVPNIVEVTFLAGSRQIQCQNEQKPHPLDVDNRRRHDTLPMAHLPEPDS